jgi:2-polyprenyl-6-methoxyphenol hydroxylase-like FAD-dependent oxidoreductase
MTAGLVIVGGGLAGLAVANALKNSGISVAVFEAAPALGEIGAAVNVSPQAVKALQGIGVGDKVAAVAHLSRGVCGGVRCGWAVFSRRTVSHSAANAMTRSSGKRRDLRKPRERSISKVFQSGLARRMSRLLCISLIQQSDCSRLSRQVFFGPRAGSTPVTLPGCATIRRCGRPDESAHRSAVALCSPARPAGNPLKLRNRR